MPATRVLIVDDMEQVRNDLRTALTLTGKIEVIADAPNGRDAVHLTKSLRPDVVLMDMEMPVLDGYEATRQIKAESRFCRVVALTVHGYEEARQKAYQSGVDAFIIKGEPVETIVQTILQKE
jgi:pilus assembly protein CpaE